MGKSFSARTAIAVAALTFIVGSLGSPMAASAVSAPANDNFADAQLLVGARGVVNGNSTAATMETDEWWYQYADSHSVWYQWVAPADRWVSFDTCGSGSGSFDTVVAVFTFTGTPGDWTGSWGNYFNDDDCPANKSFVARYVNAGTTYWIQVTGYYAWSYGQFRLSWRTGLTFDDVVQPVLGGGCSRALRPRDGSRPCPPDRGRR